MEVSNISSARAEFIASMSGYMAELEARIEGRRGVIALHNSVVRSSSGLYLVPKGNGYGVGSILNGVVMWSPADAEKMAAHARSYAGSEDARAVYFVDALRDELAEARRLVDNLKARAA